MIFEQLDEFIIHLTPEKRLLGLDVGLASIGVALSDVSQFIASPLDIIARENMNKDTGKVLTFMKQHDVTALVLGLPVMMNGEEGDTCALVRQFANKLSKKTDLPIYLQDERMSTQAVERVLHASNMTRKKQNAVDDKMAAAYILQSMLDATKQL